MPLQKYRYNLKVWTTRQPCTCTYTVYSVLVWVHGNHDSWLVILRVHLCDYVAAVAPSKLEQDNCSDRWPSPIGSPSRVLCLCGCNGCCSVCLLWVCFWIRCIQKGIVQKELPIICVTHTAQTQCPKNIFLWLEKLFGASGLGHHI